MENFFTEANLSALREMALRHTAHEVEEKRSVVERQERILICLTDRPASAVLIRRGKRVADYLRAGCVAVHVARNAGDREAVERHLNFARNLRIETHTLDADDVPRAIVEFARSERVTQIFMGRSQPRAWWKFGPSITQQVVRQAQDMQVTIVAGRRARS